MAIENAIGWLSKAIEVDTGFVNAYVFLSFSYVAVSQDEQSKIWCDKVYDKRDELSVREKLSLDHLHAYHYETPVEEMRFCRQILEMDEMNTTYWHFLGEAIQNTTFLFLDGAYSNWEELMKPLKSSPGHGRSGELTK